MNSSVSYDAFVPVHDDVDKYHCCYLVNSNKAIVAGPFSSIESACEQRASEAVGTNTVWSAKIVRNI